MWLRREARVLALALGILTSPRTSVAQVATDLFPGGTLPHLLAPQREPTVSAKLAFNAKGPTQFGDIVTGDVALGARLPFVRFRSTPARTTVDIGVEAGVFAQFNMQTVERDLIATDWVFGVPIVLRRAGSWFRLRYRHLSSHLGDEYAERFDTVRTAHNRDALDGTAYYKPLPQLAVYAGVRWGLVVEPPGSGRMTLHGGVEIEARTHEAFGRPFLAADLRWDDDSDRVGFTLKGGARMWALERRPDVRFFVEYYAGPSPMGEFAGIDATWFGMGVTISP